MTTEEVLGWYPVAGATGYLVGLSRDAEGAAQIYQNELTGLRHQIEAVAAGSYFISVRAQDENGFKGFT